MSKLFYIDGGDIRCPKKDGIHLLLHVVNDAVIMGSGVAMALTKKWAGVRGNYMAWGLGNETRTNSGVQEFDKTFRLGNIQVVPVDEDVYVVNMIAQRDIYDMNGVPPIRYDALRECIKRAREYADWLYDGEREVNINVPYLMGCDLAGGDWNIVEQIMKEELVDKGWNVFVHDFYHKRVDVTSI